MCDRTKERKTRSYYQMLVTCTGKDFWDKVHEEDNLPVEEEGRSQSKNCIYPARATRRKKNAKHKKQLLQTYLVMKMNEPSRLEKLHTEQNGMEKPYLRLERMYKEVKKRKLTV